MIRAILAGQKTQTRRVLRDQNPIDLGAFVHGAHLSRRPVFDKIANAVIGHRLAPVSCPYGQPGDSLWVRETHAIVPRTAYRCSDGVQQVLRPDDDHDAAIFRASFDRSGNPGWRPSIHMPRWASRITLEITGLRVERLQAISEADAAAEGCPGGHGSIPGYAYSATPGEQFIELWKSINGADSWAANPWVWVVDFRRQA